MQAAWRDAGRDPARLTATAAIAGCVLGDGEPSDSPRAKAHAGPTATIALHNLVERDQFGDLGRPLPPSLVPLLEQYRKIYLGYEPADARYLSNHRGHLMFLRPEEQAICTAELIRATTFTAPKAELRERIRELGRAGFDHVGLTVRHGYPEMLEEWSDVFEGV
jgi:5,10-methylenetetrahydromethanopterin reductase